MGKTGSLRILPSYIVRARQEKEIETTGELIEIIKAAIPAKVRATGGHPAKRTFQAIRIELNKELEVLENSIDKMTDLLAPWGQTFHYHLPFAGRPDCQEPLQNQ